MRLLAGPFLVWMYAAVPLYSDSFIVPVEYGETYSNQIPISKGDKESIRNHLEYLIQATIERDFSKLPEHVHPTKGLYVDLKGYMDIQTLKKEISGENSYFSIYFFDTNKLKSQKKTENVRTVRDLLHLSGGLVLDFHCETLSYVEVKIRFKKNGLYETEMNNPVFIKVKGKWYLYRLF